DFAASAWLARAAGVFTETLHEGASARGFVRFSGEGGRAAFAAAEAQPGIGRARGTHAAPKTRALGASGIAIAGTRPAESLGARLRNCHRCRGECVARCRSGANRRRGKSPTPSWPALHRGKAERLEPLSLMLRAIIRRTSGVKTPEFARLFGTTEVVPSLDGFMM